MAKKKQYKLLVKVRRVDGNKWYKKGQTYEVLPEVTTKFVESGEPYFQMQKGCWGIPCAVCTILKSIEI